MPAPPKPFGFAIPEHLRGSMTSYQPTFREMATDYMRGLFSDDREGQRKAERLSNVLETVTPFGFATAVDDVKEAVGQGDWATAGMMGAMAMVPGPSPKIRAYHGSPHSFDRFDMSKIGTGEGAQAYGHGLYFAENEAVAKGYRDAMKPGGGLGPEDTAARALEAVGGDRDAAIAELRRRIDNANARNVPYEDIRTMMDAKNILNTDPAKATGSMYEVNINASPDDFLDWDKPLSEQSESVVRALRERLGYKDAPFPYSGLINEKSMLSKDASGEEIYRAVGKERDASKMGASDGLREAGIPGIKYLDAGSRGKGDGSRNYVVFDDKLIEIVRKYGIAGASAMMGYNILDGMDEAQAAQLQQIDQSSGW